MSRADGKPPAHRPPRQPRQPRPSSVALILFSRAPVAGKTKTRLIPALGPEGARDFHAACLNDLIAEAEAWKTAKAWKTAQAWKATRRTMGEEASVHLFITPPGAQAAFHQAGVNWPGDFSLHGQRGESLGARMADAFTRVQRGKHGPRRVLLVGTDLPLLTAAHLNAATDALADADVVFGPTKDGGYYLVALKGAPGALFEITGWGGDTVLADSLAQARQLETTTSLIDELPDADTPEGLAALLAHPLAGELAQRESLRFLRNLFL